MNKVRFTRADGDWAGFPYLPTVTEADVRESGSSPGRKTNTSSIWDSIKGEINGWITTTTSGIAGIVAAKNPQKVENKTPQILAIAGVVAVVLIIVLVLILKK